jgi:hypothetical protein
MRSDAGDEEPPLVVPHHVEQPRGSGIATFERVSAARQEAIDDLTGAIETQGGRAVSGAADEHAAAGVIERQAGRPGEARLEPEYSVSLS